MTVLRSLKLSHMKKSEFNVPQLLEENVAVQHLELMVVHFKY